MQYTTQTQYPDILIQTLNVDGSIQNQTQKAYAVTATVTQDDAANTAQAVLVGEAVATALNTPPAVVPPTVIQPGGAVVDSLGGVMAVRAADGAVFRNGKRLGVAAASQAMLYGDGVFMHGKTDGFWWEWTGSAWVQLSGQIELDTAVFP